MHYGEHRIILPGEASWKRLCSSSVPPDDDDDVKCTSVQLQKQQRKSQHKVS